MFSRFFIDRPIFSVVIALLMILAGLLTVRTLPIAQYPDITPPTVSVMASYPGADAKTVAQTIGVPLEEQINGVEGMMYMSSNSGNDGSYNLQVTFENGTDVDEAAIKIQNRISQVEASLPGPVRQQGVSVRSRSSNIILFVALETTDTARYSSLFLTNYAKLHMVDALARVEGVGGVSAFGAGDYSMRVWLDPEMMRVRNLTPADVSAAIKSQNMQVSAGSVGAAPTRSDEQFHLTITARGRLQSPAEFADIVLRANPDGSMLRLRDVARVELGSDSYGQIAEVNNQNAALIGIYQLPGANALEVTDAAIKKLEALGKNLPDGINYRVILNTSDYVDASIDELVVTFVETSLLVMLVILLFLQNWRAVIIPFCKYVIYILSFCSFPSFT